MKLEAASSVRNNVQQGENQNKGVSTSSSEEVERTKEQIRAP
jgi:hypothetical protein